MARHTSACARAAGNEIHVIDVIGAARPARAQSAITVKVPIRYMLSLPRCNTGTCVAMYTHPRTVPASNVRHLWASLSRTGAVRGLEGFWSRS